VLVVVDERSDLVFLKPVQKTISMQYRSGVSSLGACTNKESQAAFAQLLMLIGSRRADTSRETVSNGAQQAELADG
jgi:hypothetical protein